jgi:hypothetical protein
VVQVDSVAPGLNLTLSRGVELRIVREAVSLSIGGAGSVRFFAGATGQDIEMKGIRLWVDEQAVLTELTGQATLGHAPRAHLIGSPRVGFRLVDILLPTNHPLEGAVLQDIEIPPTVRGRQQLAYVEEASHFTPYIRRLPWRYRRPFARRRRQGWTTPIDRAALANESEYTRTLARLAATKGAPGSVRTQLTCAAYRLRNLTAATTTERGLLSAYRCIGYGERAMPAVGVWLLAALLAIPVGQGFNLDTSVTGIRHLIELWWSYVLSPLHLLHLGGSDGTAGTRELAARVLVAAPFVTAVLATRKYVKADRDNP